jgi:hypothetical protein
MDWTVEKLASKTVHERHQLWMNARSKSTAEAKALVQMIETCGLPFSEAAALKASDPLVQKMIDIINSQVAVKAAIDATEAGLPALQGVDPILSQTLGVDYGPHNRGTLEAGYWVAQMMHSKGYKNSGKKGGLPASCIAKTAEIFVPNSKFPSKKQ